MGFQLHQIENSQGSLHLVGGLDIVYGFDMSRFGRIIGKLNISCSKLLKSTHGVCVMYITTNSTHVSFRLYIHIYIYIYREREKERSREIERERERLRVVIYCYVMLCVPVQFV